MVGVLGLPFLAIFGITNSSLTVLLDPFRISLLYMKQKSGSIIYCFGNFVPKLGMRAKVVNRGTEVTTGLSNRVKSYRWAVSVGCIFVQEWEC